MMRLLTATLILFLVSVAARTEAPEYLYSTNFPTTEFPISQNGKWLSGASGLDWGDVRTTPGLVFGGNLPSKYGDPTAVVTGDWNPDQGARGVVHVGTTPTKCCHEVELRLRTKISPHSITGYEIICSIGPDNPYIEIVRWNGRLNDFEYLSKQNRYYCKDGDVLIAKVVGNLFAVILNGKQVLTATDDKFRSGSPGVGFYDDVDNDWANFGFSEFDAGTQ